MSLLSTFVRNQFLLTEVANFPSFLLVQNPISLLKIASVSKVAMISSIGTPGFKNLYGKEKWYFCTMTA